VTPVNRKYDINPELFLQLDDGDRRGRDHKLFKKRFRLNVSKYAFSNTVTDNYRQHCEQRKSAGI